MYQQPSEVQRTAIKHCILEKIIRMDTYRSAFCHQCVKNFAEVINNAEKNTNLVSGDYSDYCLEIMSKPITNYI